MHSRSLVWLRISSLILLSTASRQHASKREPTDDTTSNLKSLEKLVDKIPKDFSVTTLLKIRSLRDQIKGAHSDCASSNGACQHQSTTDRLNSKLDAKEASIFHGDMPAEKLLLMVQSFRSKVEKESEQLSLTDDKEENYKKKLHELKTLAEAVQASAAVQHQLKLLLDKTQFYLSNTKEHQRVNAVGTIVHVQLAMLKLYDDLKDAIRSNKLPLSALKNFKQQVYEIQVKFANIDASNLKEKNKKQSAAYLRLHDRSKFQRLTRTVESVLIQEEKKFASEFGEERFSPSKQTCGKAAVKEPALSRGKSFMSRFRSG